MRKKLFILSSLVCIVAISSPVYALPGVYFDYADFLANLGSLTLTVDDFESSPWPPANTVKTQPTVSKGVSWTAAEDLFATSATALSGNISITSLDGVGFVADELNAVLPAGVFAVGGFVDNFDGNYAKQIRMSVFDAADIFYAFGEWSGNYIDWLFIGVIANEPIGRAQFLAITDAEPDNFAVDDFQFGVAAVPEPSTMLLLGTGLVGLVGFRRKFKR